MESPGVESQWGQDFAHPSRLAMWPNKPHIFSPGLERPGNGDNHSPPPSVQVKERVELYLYSPSEPSWPILGREFEMCCNNHYIIMHCSYRGADKSLARRGRKQATFPAFYGTWTFITTFTRVHKLYLP